MTWDKEIQLQPTVDRILDFHLRFGKRNLDEESPKSVCSKNNRGSKIGSRNARIRTRHSQYTRKYPYRGPSVPLHWGPRGLRRMFEPQYAEPWGQLGVGPSRRLVRHGHCIACCMGQNVWGPSDT